MILSAQNTSLPPPIKETIDPDSNAFFAVAICCPASYLRHIPCCRTQTAHQNSRDTNQIEIGILFPTDIVAYSQRSYILLNKHIDNLTAHLVKHFPC